MPKLSFMPKPKARVERYLIGKPQLAEQVELLQARSRIEAVQQIRQLEAEVAQLLTERLKRVAELRRLEQIGNLPALHIPAPLVARPIDIVVDPLVDNILAAFPLAQFLEMIAASAAATVDQEEQVDN